MMSIKEKGGVEVGKKLRVIQVQINLTEHVRLFALQSTRSRQGVLTGASSLKT